ncbi:MAG TPA: type II secretion system protein [Thermoguttaceae bacterium]|nr:type II secretion system protein [Thermoguttaceae bacterium]
MRHRNLGFTLIEVLIVVVIMAVLAATIIPQFTASTDDAKDSAASFNTHSLRAQIELYKVDHGVYPTITGTAIPGLLNATNAAGATGTGAGYPFGPYVAGEMPKNPYNSSNTVVDGTGAAEISGGYGWQYDDATGRIVPNNAKWLTANPQTQSQSQT